MRPRDPRGGLHGYSAIARLETMLMRDFLADGVLEDDVDWTWVVDVPCGPSPEGIRRLQAIQEHYGAVNVRTGNADPRAMGRRCGIYVRSDVMVRSPNPMGDYLS